jgi:hypothetical protein
MLATQTAKISLTEVAGTSSAYQSESKELKAFMRTWRLTRSRRMIAIHGRRVRRLHETCRAAFSGALTARELWFESIWLLSVSVTRLPYGDAGQWP